MQDDVNLHILNMLEDTFSLEVDHMFIEKLEINPFFCLYRIYRMYLDRQA